MPPSSPTVASWDLVRRLRQRRTEVGVETKTITEQLGFSRNYWSAVENERAILSEEKLAKLVELLEFGNDEQRELLRLREVAKQRGWWASYSGILSAELQRLFGFEYGAETVRDYESLLIPGLLQTADYARAIMTPPVTIRLVEVDQLVEARLRRQERLEGDDPLRLIAVISEAALLQQIGGPEVLRRQLEHLVAMIEGHPDTVSVLVIPFTATECSLFGVGTVRLLDFPNPTLPRLGWQETVTVQGIIDDPRQVRDLSSSYDQALKRALSTEDSVNLIHQRVGELA